MPTPEAIRLGQADPFALDRDAQRDNRVTVAYSTNRLPVGAQEQQVYVTLFDDSIRLGAAEVRIGDETLSADELYAQSTTETRQQDLALHLDAARELATFAADDDPGRLPPDVMAFFDRLNQALARSADRDLIVYVHGANNNFYRSMAQGAQFHHFTGRNSVVLVFSWPSAESLLRYAVDVNNARATAPVFADLLELLAQHTQARQIDILAYSAGAQVLSPALAELRRRHADDDPATLQARLRLGEIYFAAPDVDFTVFVADLADYIDMSRHVTLAANPGDLVLDLAAGQHGVSRAGSPDPDELTPAERELVAEATRTLPFDVIWVDPDTIPGLDRGAHNFWYGHPWVSTDVLLQLMLEARPQERGLAAWDEEGQVRVWYFPPDYPERVTTALERLREDLR